MKTVGIVLAAGSGKRMGTSKKKQYLLVKDRPILFYSLKAFEDSFIDEVILVTSADDMDFVKKDIIDKYGLTKVRRIVEGGKERYNSVLNGLKAIDDADYVFIHDGARPMISTEILQRGFEVVKEYKACVVGMPSKDTVKIADDDGFVSVTPKRSRVWNVQTPQIFDFSLIKEAYISIVAKEEELKAQGIAITDDAMILEEYSHYPIRLVEGSYENIKVTTPEDMVLAEQFLS